MNPWLNALTAIGLLAGLLGPAAGYRPPDQSGGAVSLLVRMTPAERVGQLFLATFYGPSAQAGSDIARLITEYHVGGVLLLAANDNLTATLDTPRQVLSLTSQLQSLAVEVAQVPRPLPPDDTPVPAPFVPLLIGLSQEGDTYPFSALQSGLTELPPAMAIGATWDPAEAEAMGSLVGGELSALGVNMLFGPVLDVLDTPRPQSSGDPGPRALGGDPFWVGQMGQAYVRGVHAGSEGRMAVVAKHFPGLGSSDRNPLVDQDVPTVRRVLEQLKQVELVPFLAVAGEAPGAAAVADALLTTHIRYVGFQGNLRQSTNPVSLDQQALGQLIGLPELTNWRSGGGVLVSDALGARSIKRFFDPTERTFNNKRIAREAFAAGNDLLILADFGRNPLLDQTATIIDTLDYFTQQYSTDAIFAEKVDTAVVRILTLKLRLYGQLTPERVVPPGVDLAGLGQGAGLVQELAQAAVSSVGLRTAETAERAPEPPAAGERIVFFTDTRTGRQCSTCAPYSLIERRALEQAVLQLYGPSGSGQVREGDLRSFAFDELAVYLAQLTANPPPPGPETPTPTPSPVEAALSSADWIVFGMLDMSPDVPASSVVRDFLRLRPELARSKKVVVFAFSAPYFLDPTEVSKLTAFYAVYGRSAPFIATAAQLLFRDLVPRGAPPVSVESVGYRIAQVTAPDPAQVIDIASDRLQGNVGDTIQLQTGVIRDLNGHPVPDGTPVRFLVLYKDDILPALLPAATRAGVAATSLTLNRIGQVEIRAESEPALSSIALQINVQQGTPFVITVVAPPPTPAATDTPAPTDTPVPTDTPAPTVAPTPSSPGSLSTPGRVAGRDFFMMMLVLVAAIGLGYRLGASTSRPEASLRVALAGALGVLLGYNFFALGLPGADLALPMFGIWAASAYAVLGGAVGLGLGWYRWGRS